MFYKRCCILLLFISVSLSGCSALSSFSATPIGKAVGWAGFSHLMFAATVREGSYQFAKDFLGLSDGVSTAVSTGATCATAVLYTLREKNARGDWNAIEWGADSFLDAAAPLAYCVYTVDQNHNFFGDSDDYID